MAVVKTQKLADLATAVDESIHGFLNGRGRGVALLHLGLEIVLIVGPHHEEMITPFIHCDLCFGLNDRVYPSNWTRAKTHTRARAHRDISHMYKTSTQI